MKKTKVVFLTFIPSFLGGAVGDPNWCWENMPKQIYEVTFGGKLAWHFLVPVLLLSWEILQNTSVALCESGIRIENALISRLCTCLHVYIYREQSETSDPWILSILCHILQLDGVLLANNTQTYYLKSLLYEYSQ